ncbi:uncharacterized protein LOC124170306 [Ischnura elegans]|uniref:uncharacterized protein LOC124170306 n=1 Tax=Ischnura elegans TaxID=197161 RepID=UPI001ED8A93E|nr:uncharacterized protein LOC124170306 [Ischnura elegans]
MGFIEDHVSARESVSSLDEDFELQHAHPPEVELEEDIPILEEGDEGARNLPGPSSLMDIVFLEDTPRPSSAPPLREKGVRSETPSPGISPAPSKRRKITSP